MILEFAAPKRIRKPRTCAKGYACGNSCINKGFKCKKKFNDQASTYAGWLKDLGTKVGDRPSLSKENAIAKERERIKSAIEKEDINELIAIATEASAVLNPDIAPNEDFAQLELFKKLGYDRPPIVKSKAEIDKILATGDAREIYRGMAGKNSDRYAEDYRSGRLYGGLGVHGNGTYFAVVGHPETPDKHPVDKLAESREIALGEAKSYAIGEGDSGAVLRGVIPPFPPYKHGSPDDYMAARNKSTSIADKLTAHPGVTTSNHSMLLNFWYNAGNIMAGLGYDGYTATKPSHYRPAYHVSLNRSKIVVQKENKHSYRKGIDTDGRT
jgi:hypothetical protein